MLWPLATRCLLLPRWLLAVSSPRRHATDHIHRRHTTTTPEGELEHDLSGRYLFASYCTRDSPVVWRQSADLSDLIRPGWIDAAAAHTN